MSQWPQDLQEEVLLEKLKSFVDGSVESKTLDNLIEFGRQYGELICLSNLQSSRIADLTASLEAERIAAALARKQKQKIETENYRLRQEIDELRHKLKMYDQQEQKTSEPQLATEGLRT